MRTVRAAALAFVVCGLLAGHSTADPEKNIQLSVLGTYASGATLGSEIAAYDPATRRLFITNIATKSIDIVNIANPAAPSFVGAIAMGPYGLQGNSVAVHDGVVVVAVQAMAKTDPGKAVFFDTNGNHLATVTVGALPDMITFTPDGTRLLVANEGEPNNYLPGNTDPEGSVSIIDITNGVASLTQADVTTAGFTAFNGAVLDPSIRIFGPGASVAQDLEPEYIAVSRHSQTAWVTLQENNAVGELDIVNGMFTRLIGLGFKDHFQPGAALDGSDRDGPGNTPTINIANWPVLGMYQPDAIATYRIRGRNYFITANEGDARDYAGLAEEVRVSTLSLDPTEFADPVGLKTNAQIGRLTVSNVGANTDGDAFIERLLAFGARSFSIWSEDGLQVFDSGDDFERITADVYPTQFNSTNDSNTSFDTRSDNKGPEPEGLAIEKIWGRWYAFVGLERIGGVMVYDITDPSEGRFVQYINNRNFAGAPLFNAGDLGPEGLFVIPGTDSPTGSPLLVVSNETSGTTTIYTIAKAKK